jgi:two-component system OmpR family response regulator
MRVMLAEDDPDIRMTLEGLLKENGFIVDACSDGQEAMTLGLENDYSVVILDPGLPTFSGEQIIVRWRREGRGFPIIIITGTRYARDQVRELIKLGIDQYVSKPIMDYGILIDWVKTRSNSSRVAKDGSIIRRGDLEIDTENYIVRYKDKRIKLSESEFLVLRELALSDGSPLTARSLSSRCFDEAEGSREELVRTYVDRIRKKFGFNIVTNASGAKGYLLG